MIEINSVTKKYGSIYAVRDVSFTVKEGEIMGFLGPNGAGKSTTLNILTGYISSTSGSAKIDGIDILDDPIAAKKKIGFLPEQPPLYTDMTVKEYLNFVYELKDCRLNRKKHIEEICSVVRIDDVFNRIIKNLSKGYRQRVGIAQALIGNPPVLIFDEPTVGLDPKQIIDIRTLIRSLGKDHTVILSTHILSEVQAICDRIVVINKGEIVADQRTGQIAQAVSGPKRLNLTVCGPQGDVLKLLKGIQGVGRAEITGACDQDSFTYLVEMKPGIDVRKPIFYALSAKGWPLIGMENVGMNLEDVFMDLIGSKKTK
ncbi:MAG: ATP-binding cassette domain-containing protein [Clostridia bacterium]|nr:ATP-binding cassette domain-containing protein [Clostridia bacterium]